MLLKKLVQNVLSTMLYTCLLIRLCCGGDLEQRTTVVLNTNICRPNYYVALILSCRNKPILASQVTLSLTCQMGYCYQMYYKAQESTRLSTVKTLYLKFLWEQVTIIKSSVVYNFPCTWHLTDDCPRLEITYGQGHISVILYNTLIYHE